MRPRAGIIGQVGKEGIWNTKKDLVLPPLTSGSRFEGLKRRPLSPASSPLPCFPTAVSFFLRTHLFLTAAGLFWKRQVTAADSHVLDQSKNLFTVVGMREAGLRTSAGHSIQRLSGPGLVAYACNPITWGTEAGGLFPFKTSLDHRVKLFQNK